MQTNVPTEVQQLFLNELSGPSEQFRNAKDNEQRRHAAKLYQVGLHNAFRKLNLPGEINNVPLALLENLDNASAGRQNPLMEPPQNETGRPKAPESVKSIMAAISVAMSLLMEINGLTAREAAHEVASTLRGKGFSLPIRTPLNRISSSDSDRNDWNPDAKAIFTWRKRFLAEPMSAELREKYYLGIKRTCREAHGEHAAAALLNAIVLA